MAAGKKIVYWYVDWEEIFSKLSDDEAGKLIKHFSAYVSDKNPTPVDRTTELLFIPIQSTLRRDLKKYEGKCEKNKLNGSLGGRPKKPKKTEQNRTVILETQHNPEKPDKDRDRDRDMDMDTDRDMDKDKEVECGVPPNSVSQIPSVPVLFEEPIPPKQQKIFTGEIAEIGREFIGKFNIETIPPEHRQRFIDLSIEVLTRFKRVMQMKEPLTASQFYALLQKYKSKQVMDVLGAMHNHADLLKKNINANLTAQNWINGRNKNG